MIEEKGPTLERLMKDELYGMAAAPRILGKQDEEGKTLMVSHGFLDADKIVGGLRSRLECRLAEQ